MPLAIFRVYNSSSTQRSLYQVPFGGGISSLKSTCMIFYADVKFYDCQNQITNANLCFKLGICEVFRFFFFFLFRYGDGYLFVLSYRSFILPDLYQ